MAHRESEAGAPSPFAVIGLRSMTPVERAAGRFMRAPDHGEADLPAPVVEDDPIKRIAASLGNDDEPAADDDAPDEAPEGEEETDATDESAAEESTDDTDEPESPAIDPPVSWDKEAKELFAQLPPALQTKVAEREAQRDRLVQQRTTEAAEAKRTAREEAANEFVQHQRVHAQQLDQYAQMLTPQRPDPALLRGTDEDRAYYYELQAYHEAATAQLEQIQQQAQQARADADARERDLANQQMQREIEHLAANLPEWGDPGKRQELLTGLTKVGAELGYSPELMAQAGANDILALKKASEWKAKADKYDALQKSKMAAVRSAKELPKTIRPNAPQPPGSAALKATQQQRDRLRSSGDVRDAAALIASRL